MTAWYVAHKLVDAVMYLFATKYLTTWAVQKVVARRAERARVRDAARRLSGDEHLSEWTGNHESGGVRYP